MEFFKKMKWNSKKDDVEKLNLDSETENDNEEDVYIDEDGDTYEQQQKPYEEYKNLSLDEIEHLYDKDELDIETKETSEIDDISEQVSKRGFNKRVEHLSEKDRKYKEKQEKKKKEARRQLKTGTISLVFLIGSGAAIFYVFEEPIVHFASSTLGHTQEQFNTLVNEDVKSKFKNNFLRVLEPEEDVLVGEYNEPVPNKINTYINKKEDATLTDGNYFIGEHAPEGIYVLEGQVNIYANDLDLVGNTIAQTYENDLVFLSEGSAVKVKGELYPIQYKEQKLIPNTQMSSNKKYHVGKDVQAGKGYVFSGKGTVSIYDSKLNLLEQIEVKKPTTLKLDKKTYVSFSEGVDAK